MHITGFTHSLLLSGNAGDKSIEIGSNILEPSQTLSDRRRLQGFKTLSPIESCLELTNELGLGDVLGVALGSDSFNTTEHCDLDMICDIELSPMYADSISACTLVGGQIIRQNFTVCGQDFCLNEGCTADNIPPDYQFVNIPMCFAQGCVAGTTDYLLLGRTAYQVGSTRMQRFGRSEDIVVPATFIQQCGINPNIIDPINVTPLTAGVSDISDRSNRTDDTTDGDTNAAASPDGIQIRHEVSAARAQNLVGSFLLTSILATGITFSIF